MKGFGVMMWLAFDEDKSNYPKRIGILMLFGALQVMTILVSPPFLRCVEYRTTDLRADLPLHGAHACAFSFVVALLEPYMSCRLFAFSW